MAAMATDDDVVALAKMVVKQAVLLNAAIQQLGDQAVVVEASLERCLRCDLAPATVQHLGFHACDRCAAELIVMGEPEEQWIDLQDAVRTRRVVDYVHALRSSEAQDMVH